MAELDVQDATLDGITLDYVSADSEGDTFRVTSDTRIFLKNTGSSEAEVTLVAQKECNQGHLHDKEYDLDDSEEIVISNIEPSRFKDEDGLAHLDYSDATDVEVAVVRD